MKIHSLKWILLVFVLSACQSTSGSEPAARLTPTFISGTPTLALTSPKRVHIAFYSQDISTPSGMTTLYMINPDGTGLTELLTGLGSSNADRALSQAAEAWSLEAASTLSPSGTVVVFNSISEKDQQLIDINKRYTLDKIGCKNGPDCPAYADPAWSPDGSKIAFSGSVGQDPDQEIYLANIDGSERTKLTDNTAKDDYPLWSPDGRKIAFLSNRDGKNGIYVMNVNGSQQVLLTNDAIAKDIRATAWSPDSKRLVFSSSRAGDWELYIMNIDGSNQIRLTFLAGEEWGSVWVP